MEQETTTLETENGTGDLPKLRNRKVKKSRLPLLIGLLILGGIASAGVYFYLQSANFETTDNARHRRHLTSNSRYDRPMQRH